MASTPIRRRAEVERLLGDLDVSDVVILQGIFPDDTGHLLSSTLSLVHIDVDVYQSAKDSVDFVWDRLPAGGILVFDDYGFSACEGVTKYVNELAQRHDVVMVHNLNGHAVLVRLK